MWKQRAAGGIVLASLCLLPACATIDRDYEKADAEHEDIIDRGLAPLDDTITDINRDLNKKDKGDNGN
jgi:hypothetical protein